ncbi:Dynein assembly factor 1, axonemal [Chytridiales sp. JEL 0842]|nr:Dynein assembly factor 1, axonemal [Chytridiales sp. JEL 0842]
MTPKYLKQLCVEQKAYQTPSLNDKLYFHFKGFARIENLEAYTGCKSLWLEGNGIGKIENLDALTELRCLFLHQNCIEIIENLDSLQLLDTLSLGNNLIKSVSGLSNLPNLRTLQLDHNFLKSADDIRHLLDCPSIGILDLSFNKIDDPEIVAILEQMPELAVLNLMSNPVISKIPNYRKTLISKLKKLTYLDDRPVFDKERLATEAWVLGGIEAERAERVRQQEAEREEQRRNFEGLLKLQEAARLKRIEKYGPDQEPEFPEKLREFRDEQLRKVDPTLESFHLAPPAEPSAATEKVEDEPSRIESLTKEVDLLEFGEEAEDIPKIVEVSDEVAEQISKETFNSILEERTQSSKEEVPDDDDVPPLETPIDEELKSASIIPTSRQVSSNEAVIEPADIEEVLLGDSDVTSKPGNAAMNAWGK